MDPTQNPEPQKSDLQSLRVDPELIETLRIFVLEAAKNGTEADELLNKINALLIGHTPGEACGVALVTVMWLARQVAKDIGAEEKTVLASMCYVMLQMQQRIEIRSGFSTN